MRNRTYNNAETHNAASETTMALNTFNIANETKWITKTAANVHNPFK